MKAGFFYKPLKSGIESREDDHWEPEVLSIE